VITLYIILSRELPFPGKGIELEKSRARLLWRRRHKTGRKAEKRAVHQLLTDGERRRPIQYSFEGGKDEAGRPISASLIKKGKGSGFSGCICQGVVGGGFLGVGGGGGVVRGRRHWPRRQSKSPLHTAGQVKGYYPNGEKGRGEDFPCYPHHEEHAAPTRRNFTECWVEDGGSTISYHVCSQGKGNLQKKGRTFDQ